MGLGDFFDETPKATSDFTRFEPWNVQIRSRGFSLGDRTKKGHYKNNKKSPVCGEFPTQPNSTKSGV